MFSKKQSLNLIGKKGGHILIGKKGMSGKSVLPMQLKEMLPNVYNISPLEKK